MGESVNPAAKSAGRLARAWHGFVALVDALQARIDKLVNTATKVVAILVALGLVGGAVAVTRPEPSPSAPTSREVPNVYNIPAAQATTILRNAGFAPKTIPVCSGSVARDRVRQVVTDAPVDGTVLVDADGVKPDGRSVPEGSALVVKVSTGTPCN